MFLISLFSPLAIFRMLRRTPLPTVLQVLCVMIAQIITWLAVGTAVINFFGSRAVLESAADTLTWLATDIDYTVTGTTENVGAIRWGVWIAASLSNGGSLLRYLGSLLDEDAMITAELAAMTLRWIFGKFEYLAGWLAAWFFRATSRMCEHGLTLLLQMLPLESQVAVPIALAGLAMVMWATAMALELFQTGRVAQLAAWIPRRSTEEASPTPVVILEREGVVARRRSNSVS